MSGDAIVLALGHRGSPESAGTSASLWQDSACEVATALHSPFVKGLADGSLPKYVWLLLHGKACKGVIHLEPACQRFSCPAVASWVLQV